jgi:hypothetical protein
MRQGTLEQLLPKESQFSTKSPANTRVIVLNSLWYRLAMALAILSIL